MVCIDVQTYPKWKFGSVTSRDPNLRQEAVQTMKKAMSVAARLGAMKVNFWPGQDGYDYPFQSDYAQSWKMIVDALKDASEYNRNVKRLFTLLLLMFIRVVPAPTNLSRFHLVGLWFVTT